MAKGIFCLDCWLVLMVRGTLNLDLHWFGVTRLKLEGADL
jgi:hypothetical protein